MTVELQGAGAGSTLGRLCVARLRESYSRDHSLFQSQIRDGAWGPTRGTEDLTSTAISLIGLRRAGVLPGLTGVDETLALEAILGLLTRRRYPGALGLVIWANALTGGQTLDRLLARAGIETATLSLVSRSWSTMEVAWLLSGLAVEHDREGDPVSGSAVKDVAAALLSRYEPATRLFWHATPEAPPAVRVRRFVATFADQIYPVQALAMASRVVGGPAIETASAVASKLTELQGGRGQWWWHYDPRDGRVSGSYPVYSVHQLGMVPMAFRLEAAGGPSFGAALAHGVAWLSGNELGLDLVDAAAGTVWRSIVRRECAPSRLARHSVTLFGSSSEGEEPPERLQLNRETRPYEWAWYLYALST